MEEKAQILFDKIQMMCVQYYYNRKDNVLEEAQKMIQDIQDFCGVFLQGNIFGMEEDEYLGIFNYVIQVLEDYMDALQNRDTVWMLDTLDCGLRELLEIFIKDKINE